MFILEFNGNDVYWSIFIIPPRFDASEALGGMKNQKLSDYPETN